MKIMVLNGIPDDPSLTPFIKAVETSISNNTTHKIDYFRLKDMDINYCTGCWSCWYKTPGYCIFKDDFEQILSRIPSVDLVLYITPMIMGYESAIIKTAKDRSVPILLPYIRLHNGEQHHYQRNTSTPNVSAMLLGDEATNEEDIENVKHSYQRMSLNFGTKVHSFDVVKEEGGVEDVFNRL